MLTDGAGISVGVGLTVNLFTGRPIEFIGRDSNCKLWLTSDAALQTAQLLINVGGEQKVPVASGMSVNVATAAGSGPKQDEDGVSEFAIPAGARLQLNITNGAAAAVITRYRALITP